MKQCQYCPRKTLASNDVARASGWRWHVGTTQDGRPYDDVACPHCSGNKSEDEQAWDIECRTCDWMASEDYFDQPVKNVQEAVAWGFEHRCEPEVRILDPDGNATPLHDFDRDGNLKKRKAEST